MCLVWARLTGEEAREGPLSWTAQQNRQKDREVHLVLSGSLTPTPTTEVKEEQKQLPLSGAFILLTAIVRANKETK